MSQLKKALQKKIEKQFQSGNLSPEVIKVITRDVAAKLKEKRRLANNKAKMYR